MILYLKISAQRVEHIHEEQKVRLRIAASDHVHIASELNTRVQW